MMASSKIHNYNFVFIEQLSSFFGKYGTIIYNTIPNFYHIELVGN